MLSRKSIALNITNLSDARYFAAYDVDIMVYRVESEGDNLGLIKEIVEWVEGPKSYLHLDEWSEELASFALSETGATGLLVGPDEMTSAQALCEDVMLIASFDEKWLELGMRAVLMVNGDHRVDLNLKSDRPFYIFPEGVDLATVESWITTLPDHGFAFMGGEEEKVGFKSFEDQDEMIELLME